MTYFIKYVLTDQECMDMPWLCGQPLIDYLQVKALQGLKPSTEPIHAIYNPAAQLGLGETTLYFPIETG